MLIKAEMRAIKAQCSWTIRLSSTQPARRQSGGCLPHFLTFDTFEREASSSTTP